jgi:hypothetical protein
VYKRQIKSRANQNFKIKFQFKTLRNEKRLRR